MEKELPKGWIETNLKEVLSYQKGKKPKILKDFEFENSLPYLDIKAFEKGEIVRFADVESSNIVDESSLVIVWDGARSGWVSKGKLGAIGSTLAKLSPIKSDVDFVLYFLKSKFHYINSNTRGTGIPHVDPDILWNISFPLPPLAEQKRIVTKLDTLFASLESTKTRLEKIPTLLKNFKQAILTQAVTGKLTEQWREGKELENGLDLISKNRAINYEKKVRLAKELGERKPKKLDESNFEYFSYDEDIDYPKGWELGNLKNIADLITDGEHSTPRRTDEGFYLLSARNVQNGFISLDKVDYVPEEEYLRLRKRCNPEFQDVLISCSGTVGRVSVVPKDLDFVMVRSAALVKLQWNSNSSKYIEFALRSRLVQDQMLKLQKSTAQANLFIGPIGKIVVPIPSIQEQTEIVRHVESLFAKADTIEQQYGKLRQKIDTLPQAILAKAFKGELVAQNPLDEPASVLLEKIKALRQAQGPAKRKKKVVRKKKIKVAEQVDMPIAAEPKVKYN